MQIFLTVDPYVPQPMHRQLTQQVKEAITAGQLQPGQALPSSRKLSEYLGVSRDTVVRSYEDLSGMGLIDRKRARGVYVSELEPPSA